MFLPRRPTRRHIERFLAAARELPLSYAPIGLAHHGGAGFTLDEQVTTLGSGTSVFTRSAAALADWRHFELGWVEIFPQRAPIEPGTTVAVCVRHVGFWSLNACRIVYSLGAMDGPEFGFAYGTLADHAESGEEIFKVSVQPDTGVVTYTVRAVARARAPLARLGYPVTRLLQARFRRDSASALRRAIAGLT